MAETQAQKRARLAKRRKEGVGKIVNDMFTTTAQAKKNKQFDNLQKTINIAAANKNPKAGPKTKEETFSFRNQAAEALANKKPNANTKSKPSTKKDFGKSLKQFDTSDIKSDKKTLSTSKATAATLKDLGLKSTAKKESKKQLSNKERRQQNRAANLALRTGKTLDEASALKEKRRNDRKQYLRNFASQLARGEQAAPIKGFGEGEEGKTTTGSYLVDNSGVEKEAQAKQEQAAQDQKSIYANVNTFTAPNQDLGNYSDFGKNLMQQVEMPDLSPITYMQKEYRKKRGY